MKKQKDRKDSKPTEADLAAAGRLRAAWDKAKMTRKGITQGRLAERMDITQGAVSHYLTGKNAINFSALMHFADFLDINPFSIRSDLPEQALPGLLPSPALLQESFQGTLIGLGRYAKGKIDLNLGLISHAKLVADVYRLLVERGQSLVWLQDSAELKHIIDEFVGAQGERGERGNGRASQGRGRQASK